MVVESKHHAMSWEDKILHQFQLLEKSLHRTDRISNSYALATLPFR